MRRYWDEWHSVWDVSVEVSEIRDLGDAVLTLGRMRTSGKTSGIDLERPVGFVAEFEDGLIRRIRAYENPDHALDAVGLEE